MGYIYKITNKLNNKIYIGLTTKERPTDRFSQHRYLARHLDQEKSISYLHRAMHQDGVENFSFEIIEEVENSNLNEREKYWIQQYQSLSPNGYNLTAGGEGTVGYSRSQSVEEREKKGESVRQFYINHPEARVASSERMKQKWSEDENFRNKMIEGSKNFTKNIQTILKVRIIRCMEKSIRRKLVKKLRLMLLLANRKQLNQIKILQKLLKFMMVLKMQKKHWA